MGLFRDILLMYHNSYCFVDLQMLFAIFTVILAIFSANYSDSKENDTLRPTKASGMGDSSCSSRKRKRPRDSIAEFYGIINEINDAIWISIQVVFILFSWIWRSCCPTFWRASTILGWLYFCASVHFTSDGQIVLGTFFFFRTIYGENIGRQLAVITGVLRDYLVLTGYEFQLRLLLAMPTQLTRAIFVTTDMILLWLQSATLLNVLVEPLVVFFSPIGCGDAIFLFSHHLSCFMTRCGLRALARVSIFCCVNGNETSSTSGNGTSESAKRKKYTNSLGNQYTLHNKKAKCSYFVPEPLTPITHVEALTEEEAAVILQGMKKSCRCKGKGSGQVFTFMYVCVLYVYMYA